MPKKQLALLIITLLLLAAAYAYYFTDWFASENIQIVHSLRPVAAKRARGKTPAPNPTVNAVSFSLDRKCRLTEVRVIPTAELATNKYAHPVWHLVSESNSIPVKALVYGTTPRGMHPKVKGAQADPLLPDVTYRLFVTAGDLKGEHDFKTTAKK